MAMGLPGSDDLKPRAPYWVPADGSSWYAEFVPQDRSWVGMASYSSLSALIASAYATFARASEGYYFNSSDEYQLFTSGNARHTTANGLLIEPASTRITANPSALSSWADSGSTHSAYAGTYLGVFDDALHVVSAGANFHRVIIGSNTTVTSGTPIGIVMYYSAGTSGSVRIVVRDVTGGNSSIVSGVIGSEAVSQESAGTITNLSCVTEGGIVECTFTFTPNFTNNSLQIGLGPDSATSGEDVIFYAGWAETAVPGTTPILTTQAEGESRAADVLTIFPAAGTYDITVTFDDDSTQLLAGEVVTGAGWAVPTDLDRAYIKSIAAVPA